MTDINHEQKERNHDLDALAEIVPGLISTMQMNVETDPAKYAQGIGDQSQGNEELWRVQTPVNRNAKVPEVQSNIISERAAYANDSQRQEHRERYFGSDEDSVEEGDAEAARDTTANDKPGDDALSSASLSTVSNHAKAAKSVSVLAGANSFDVSITDIKIEDEAENVAFPKNVVKGGDQPEPSQLPSGSPEAENHRAGPKSLSLSSIHPSDSETSEYADAKPSAIGEKEASSDPSPKNSETPFPDAEDPTPPRSPQPQAMMPMYLPYFKPATGCSNASDFIVRCFVARLRSGITVIKHGRSRWCKSSSRILHIHPDGRSLSWKAPLGEPTSSKRPPKLDLSTCLEVRHAWSPDPLHPLYTGTAILRQKCEAPNAHKSFALIFPNRTVDITAVTADQCKVLMEGFSALCFRLQVASLAGKSLGYNDKAEKDGSEKNVSVKHGEIEKTSSTGGSSSVASPGNPIRRNRYQ